MLLLLKSLFRECRYILMHRFRNPLDISTTEYLNSCHCYNSNKFILISLLLNIYTKNWDQELINRWKIISIGSSDSSSSQISIKRPGPFNFLITIISWLLYLNNRFSRRQFHFLETLYNIQYWNLMEIYSISTVILIGNYLH